jgi:release factor glutamine methyltransferase
VNTVAGAFAQARAAGVDRLDAQLLLARVLARPRAWLLAHDDSTLSADEGLCWQAWLMRRAAGEPLAYLIGEKEFHGLMLRVDPSVLVPRPDTEVLVDWALELLTLRSDFGPAPDVVDLGTGSGAVALAVKHGHPTAEVQATDVSPRAVEVARENAQRLGLKLTFREGSWWRALGDQRFHLALSNPPYIAADDAHLDALRHEPALALTPGGDGLRALRDIVMSAPEHLFAGAWLLLEHGFDQADAVRSLLHKRGFIDVQTRDDLGSRPRCTGGRFP